MLEKLYTKLKKLAEPNLNFIKSEDLYNELDMAKLGLETGLAIFEELNLLERNDSGIQLLPPSGDKLDKSKIHDEGQKLKHGIAAIHSFQLEQSIEEIWEEILEKVDIDNESILREIDIHKASFEIFEREHVLKSTDRT